MATLSPLTSLSSSAQNTKQQSPSRADQHNTFANEDYKAKAHTNDKSSYSMSQYVCQDTIRDDESYDMISNAPTSPHHSAAKETSTNGTASPIKSVSPCKETSAEKSRECPRSPSLGSTVRSSEGLTQRIDPPRKDGAEPDDTATHRTLGDEEMSTIMHETPDSNEHNSAEETEITLSIDDTLNDISTFSAIPNVDLTRFAALRDSTASPTTSTTKGWSPSKQLRNPAAGTPRTVRRPLRLSTRSPHDNCFDNDMTPRRPSSMSSPGDLLNFTGQSNIFIPPPQSISRTSNRRSPSGRGGFPIKINPSPTHPSQAAVDRERSRATISPVRQTFAMQPSTTPVADRRNHLLDFDLEPLATPRSIPSVTPRELESLRSELSSQICSLSATLSGKEAEVLALKRSITDAEVRVGNTSEELRNEKSLRENLEQERQNWDQRGREMENVLREIRQEIMVGEHERDKLRKQTEEAEKRTEEMEVRVVELQTRLDSANRRATLSPTSSPKKRDGLLEEPSTPSMNGTVVSGMDINEAVREATERVARDLHALYKSKHETKVAALKKSYEARWEKKVKHLEEELKAANTEVMNLKTERDATMSGPLASSAVAEEQQRQQKQQWLDEEARRSEDLLRDKEQMEADRKALRAKIEGLESELQSVKHRTDTLRDELATERLEKGELVAQVDLFLALGDDPSIAPKQNELAGGERGIRSVSTNSIPSSSTLPKNIGHHLPPPPSPATHQHQQPPPPSPARPTNPTINGRTVPGSTRPRPMSMLQPPGKFSGIPGPGGTRAAPAKSLPTRTVANGGGGIMEGIAKMGAGAGARGH